MESDNATSVVNTNFEPAAVPVIPLECYDNRELSWLKFNTRVLEEANDERNPLGERLSFLSIFQSNLDEFFMVRVGTLYDQRKTPICDNKTRMTAKEQLEAVLSNVRSLLKEKDRSYRTLVKLLEPHGMEILSFSGLSDKEKRGLERYFLAEVMPLLSPQIVTARQPFPFLNNKDIYVAVQLKRKKKDRGHRKDGKRCLGIVPCSNPVLRRMVPVSSGSSGRYVLMEDLILSCAERIFEHYQVMNGSAIRIVRNADISVDDLRFGTEGRKKDYRKVMEKMIQTRKKLCPIKLEYAGRMDADMLQSLCKYLKLPRRHTFCSSAPLDLSFLYTVRSMLQNDSSLFYPKRRPQENPEITEKETVTEQIRKKDVMLSFPYESIRPFVRLLNEAARDPEVVSIRITLYRVAKVSQITDALILAAEKGKEVTVVMELRARFDEENNVEHSRDLEEAGCRVIYGLENIKVHSKLCLITLKRGESIEYITQVGTGNYNEKTAGLYTDYSLMTANREIGEEAAEVFRSLALGEVMHSTDTLLVAPECLQGKICDKIDRQITLAKAGKSAYIGFKVNALTDKIIIDRLIAASQAGVKIQLLVRGICCLVAGIPGYTDNIEVRSIVGRYLEHGRIYIFGADGEEEVYIASADLMTRNTTRRVEVGVPVLDAGIRETLLSKFRLMLKDTVKLRVQQDDGLYSYVQPEEGETGFCSQEYFAEESYRAAGTALPEERKTKEQNAAADDYVTAEHVAEVPAEEGPTEVETAVVEPIVEEPVADEPVVEEPEVEEPEVEEPVAEEPVADEPVADEPVVEEPVAEEPVADEPVADEPVAEEPVAEGPVAEVKEVKITENKKADEPLKPVEPAFKTENRSQTKYYSKAGVLYPVGSDKENFFRQSGRNAVKKAKDIFESVRRKLPKR